MSSFLGSKPFLDKILSQLSSENISSLLSLINNPGTPTTVYLYGEQNVLSSTNIGVNYVQLMVDKLNKRYLYGFLVYIDNNNCGFFSFSGKQSPMIEIEINPVTLEYRDVYENLSAEEFRRTLADLAIEAGSVEGYVTEEELQAALVADKNILSKIVKEYDEDSDVTYINFPVGIMPLSITINTHTLYFKNWNAVDYNGQSVEGYNLDEAIFDTSGSYISFIGDISEQVIKDLIYANYNGDIGTDLFGNSYYLFFPTKIGTKLYKHIVSVGVEGSFSVELMIISTKSTSYTLSDFAVTESQDGLEVPALALAMGYCNIDETSHYQNCDYAIISNTEDGLKVFFSFGGTEIADYSDSELTTENIDTFIDSVTEL